MITCVIMHRRWVGFDQGSAGFHGLRLDLRQGFGGPGTTPATLFPATPLAEVELGPPKTAVLGSDERLGLRSDSTQGAC